MLSERMRRVLNRVRAARTLASNLAAHRDTVRNTLEDAIQHLGRLVRHMEGLPVYTVSGVRYAGECRFAAGVKSADHGQYGYARLNYYGQMSICDTFIRCEDGVVTYYALKGGDLEKIALADLLEWWEEQVENHLDAP